MRSGRRGRKHRGDAPAQLLGYSAEAPQGYRAGHPMTQNPPPGAQLPQGETDPNRHSNPRFSAAWSEQPQRPPTDDGQMNAVHTQWKTVILCSVCIFSYSLHVTHSVITSL